MKISLVQIEAIPGNLEKNCHKHVQWIDRALRQNPDLIVFPELSMSGYEPALVKDWVVDENHPQLEIFNELSKKHGTLIAVGSPIRKEKYLYIGMVIFQPDGERMVYFKQDLHEDEKGIFTKGREQVILKVKGKKVALAICYEALQESHFDRCMERGAEVYLASVSKHHQGVVHAYRFFREKAKEFELPILMVNSVGDCNNFLSAGGTSIWNTYGNLADQLGYSEEGILVYEHKRNQRSSEEITS